MTSDKRIKYINLYASILRKYYIGEEDYLYITLNGLSKREITDSWNYAKTNVKHEERITNPATLSIDEFNEALNRYSKFNYFQETVKYLFSNFNYKKLKLSDENIERRLRHLLAIKILKIIEQKINNENFESISEDILKNKEEILSPNLQQDINKIGPSLSLKRSNIKYVIPLIFAFIILGAYTVKLYTDYNTLKYIESKKYNGIIIKLNNSINENKRLDSILNNQDYLNQIIEERKFTNYKKEGYTGKIEFSEIFGYKNIKGELVNGEERGIWIYEKYNGEKEIYKWELVRTGAICRDGSTSDATGSGACSHHGGVDYWLNEYQKLKIEN
jgi:hypothetical protein